jgi:hypothetical protein
VKRILYFSWFLGAGAAAAAQVEARLASLPVAFETNAGQVSGASRFVAFGGSGVLCFERNAIVLRSDPVRLSGRKCQAWNRSTASPKGLSAPAV